MTRRIKPIRAWAGFCGKKLTWNVDNELSLAQRLCKRAAIYRTRKEAARFYADYRRIEIRPIPPKKRSKR